MTPSLLFRIGAPLLLTLAGCAALPGTGPSTGELKRAPEVEVVEVTPQAATAARAAALAGEKASIDQALAQLRTTAAEPAFRVGPGDVLDVTLWTFSPWPGGAGPTSVNNPGPIQLGTFTVAEDGSIELPYAGRIDLRGLTMPQARDAISRLYATRRILREPTAAVKLASSQRYDVLVTGSVGQPRAIAWTPAGLTLAQAVTQSLGDGNATLGQGDMLRARSAVQVSVLRGEAAPIALPIATALEERIPLRAGDRIVVRKTPAVEVTVLGGGIRKAGVLGFARQPVLSEALAEAEGLDGNTANDHAVFVLRRRDAARPVLYDFAWNRPQGLVAAQEFPLENGDLVYVAEAPIVSVQKVIGLLFQVTLPAQVLK